MTDKYKRKTSVIEAVQLTDTNKDEIIQWGGPLYVRDEGDHLVVKTPENKDVAYVGDWILKTEPGIIWTCHADLFERTYELWSHD